MMLESGQQFAHFKIISKLGEGGMGEVYLAEDQKLHRQVALKLVSGELFENQERLDRFQREAKTAAQISHAYIMSIYDIGVARDEQSGKDVHYIVMEYLDGELLTDYMRSQKPGLAKLVRLGEKIATGLAAAHKLNIVHRDIKPDNIIIDENNDPGILDFGLAKPVAPIDVGEVSDRTDSISQELTKVGKIIGTISYMSPEQVRGESVDTRSDIFSFGILLYRMVTGELPFAGPSQVDSMAKILESTHESPRTRNDAIPPELERIINKCLQKDPDDRYQDTRDLVVDLRNLRRQYDSGVTDSISTTATALKKGNRPFDMRLIWSAAAILVVCLVVVYFIRDGGTSPSGSAGGLQAKTNSLAIIGFENKTADADLDWLQTGLPEILLTDLSQCQGIHLISQQRVLDCFDVDKKASHTHEECVSAARSLGATRLLSGTFFRMGERIRIDARLEEIESGRIIMAEKVIGDDPFMLVDSLSVKIASLLNVIRTNDVTTFVSSPEAFRQYHLGMELFWVGEFDSAIAKFTEALAIDSTFALPYMRIGMANVFRGRQSEGARYLQMARQYEDRLPVRERSLLDAYIDTWASQNYDHAFTKLRTLLSNYPDDAEIRTIYAQFVDVFQQDTTAAFAQLDTVLMTYPTYIFALDNYIQLLSKYSRYDRATQMAERLIRVIPDAVSPRRTLAGLYRDQGRVEEAETIYRQLHEEFPDDVRPVQSLITVCVMKRDFKAAYQYAERLKQQKPNDPFNLRNYYNILANLANWEGKFVTSMDRRFDVFEQVRATTDSQLIFNALNSISSYYRRYGMNDSSGYYSGEAYHWGFAFNRVSHPLKLVMIDTGFQDSATPIFKQAIEDFKSHVPRDFWKVANRMEGVFHAFCRADTVAVIDGYRAVIEGTGEVQGGNTFMLGELLVRFGRYQEGIDELQGFLEGEYETTSGWTYPICCYWIGVANDELGNTTEAIKHFREMLTYWGDPEIELDEIKDARERLARLTS